VPLKSLCEARWGVATDVVNDSMAGGMASHLFDVEKSINNLVFLYLRFQDVSPGVVGVGVGVIINGAPYHGEFGAAGEITTPLKHPLTHAAEIGGEGLATLATLIDAVGQRVPNAQAAMDRVAAELSTLVIHILNLLEPGVLIVASDTPVLRDWLLERLERFVDDHRLPHQAGKTRLMASALGKYGVARGAIVPTLQRLFRIPHWS